MAVNVSSAGLAVPWSLQAEILLNVTALTLHAEQEAGAVPALLLVRVQPVFALNVAVRLMAVPSAVICTPVNVCVVVRPVTETEAVPSPVRFNVPVAGTLLKVTVTLAVKVSSPAAFVFWLLHAEILLTEMVDTLQTVPEQFGGAVPALVFVSVQPPTEKLAVRLMAEPSAAICTPVKVCEVAPAAPTVTLAVPSPLRFSKPVPGLLT